MYSLLNRTAVLRAEHYRPPGFNLFTMLRSSTDEVRLHSRYIAFLLNPEGAHGAGVNLLQVLLESLGVEEFDCEGVAVDIEYRNIDILVRNANGQAIIIENKIHAEDRDGQLFGYVEKLKAEGYQPLLPIYLTLDGSDADPVSCRGIEYRRVSYAADILPWLERCLVWVIREAGVRESLLQYIDLLKKLTLQDQGETYMDQLKQTLLKDNNLILIRDLQAAYIETLKDLQTNLWDITAKRIAEKYPELPKPCDSPTASQIDRYYSNAKNSKYYGLYYAFEFMPGGAYIELNHRLYCGYYCSADSHEQHHKQLLAMTSQMAKNGTSRNGLLWRYTTELDMKNPSNDNLLTLTDPVKRARAAERMADDLYLLWKTAQELYVAVHASH